MSEDSFEIGKTDLLVHHEAFHLMKHRRVGRVIIVPIDRARNDNLQRWLALFHGANLHRRSMSSEQHAA